MLFTSEELKVIEKIAKEENRYVVDVKSEIHCEMYYYGVGAGELYKCDYRFNYDESLNNYRVDIFAYLNSMIREIKNIVKGVDKATAKSIKKRVMKDIVNDEIEKYMIYRNSYYNYHVAYSMESMNRIFIIR